MQGCHGAPVLEMGGDAGRRSAAKCARLAALSKRSAARLIALAPAQAWFLGTAALVRTLADAIAIGMDKGRSSHRALRAGFSNPPRLRARRPWSCGFIGPGGSARQAMISPRVPGQLCGVVGQLMREA